MNHLNKKTINIKKRFACRQAGMTYVELIVVLSIFAIVSTVAIFNYGDFQANVNIRNLSTEIASKVVEAQKASINGSLPSAGYNYGSTWKPSYGIYFDMSSQDTFVYFVDLNNNKKKDGVTEEAKTITITKGNRISDVEICTESDDCDPTTGDLSITFTRPNSEAVFEYSNSDSPITDVGYIKVTISSPKDKTSSIRIYPSGRVQIN